jgi:hypothetical protein
MLHDLFGSKKNAQQGGYQQENDGEGETMLVMIEIKKSFKGEPFKWRSGRNAAPMKE